MALTGKQIDELKRELDRRYHALAEAIRQKLIQSDEERYIDLAGRVHDSGEASVADLLEDVQLETVNRYLEEFRAVDAALLRIAEDRYGLCRDCGVAIDLQRLQALPEATRCQYCQETHEAQRQHRSYGGHSL